MNGFINGAALKDFTTLVGVLVILVQFFKGAVDGFVNRAFKTTIQTKYITYLFGLVLMLVKAQIDHTLTIGAVPMLLLNGVLLALAAMKGFEEFSNVTGGSKTPPVDSGPTVQPIDQNNPPI